MSAERMWSAKKIQRRPPDKPRTPTRPGASTWPRPGLVALQQRIGNRAVQRLLVQPQGEARQNQAKEPVEIGQVKIEKPEIKGYDVTGTTLAEVSKQLLPPKKWYEYKYEYKPKLDKGVVTQVDVTVRLILHVPRWIAPGWTHAAEMDKKNWLEMLKTFAGGFDKYDEKGKLAQGWLGIDFEKAPETIKGPWQAMLQEMQQREMHLLDLIRRRVLILQQRLIRQPEDQLKVIFDRFQQDIELEEKAYNQDREFGKKPEIALSVEELVK